MEKDTKKIIIELQEIADKHLILKNEIEFLIQEGEKIEDKLKDSDRLFSIAESINKIMEEIEETENKYHNVLEEYKKIQ